MSKTVKFGIIFFLALILLLVVYMIIDNPSEDKIKNYLLSMGYVADAEDETRLSKYVDGTTIDYFSLAEYTLTRNVEETSNTLSFNLTMKYDYKNHELTFYYRTTNKNNINVIFRGDYQDEKFNCDKEFSTASLSSDEISNTCSLIKLKVERLSKEAQILFKNHQFIEYMESVTLE